MSITASSCVTITTVRPSPRMCVDSRAKRRNTSGVEVLAGLIEQLQRHVRQERAGHQQPPTLAA